MKDDVTRNLRLACAATLLSIWGMAHLAAVPVLGDTLAPLLLALVVAPGSPFAHWRANRAGAVALGIALLALLAITTLLARVGSAEELLAFAHSPWFVLPVWGLGLFGLVRNATAAARSAPMAGEHPATADDASALPAPVVPSRRR